MFIIIIIFSSWFLDTAFARTCAPDPRGPEHPMLSSTIVVVGTVGARTRIEIAPGRGFYTLTSVIISEIIKGDPTLREVKVRLSGSGMKSVGEEGTTVLLHLTPHPHMAEAYYFAGRTCYEFPAVEKYETGKCGAVARFRTGEVLATYPSSMSTLPSVFSVGGELSRVDERVVQSLPTPDELCDGTLWSELLINVKEAANSETGVK